MHGQQHGRSCGHRAEYCSWPRHETLMLHFCLAIGIGRPKRLPDPLTVMLPPHGVACMGEVRAPFSTVRCLTRRRIGGLTISPGMVITGV